MSKRVHDETAPETEDLKESTATEVKDSKTEVTEDKVDAENDESSTKKQKVEDKVEDKVEGKPGQRKRQFAKKKVALLFAYCGLDYQGLQINPNAKTVEGVLIEALNKVDAIPNHHVDSLQKINWMRACRTDKGVHALGNVISFKMQYNDSESLDTVRDRVNAILPPHVKIFHIYRTLGGFHCKNAVDYRVYDYICPTYAFIPIIAGNSAKFTPEMLEKVRSLFTVYEGTHNYHNFTTGKDAEDADANRYIKSITVSDPFVLDDVEIVKIQLTGQSFILNQIRKMVGLVILAMRYTGSFKTIIYVLKETRYVHFVMAPGEFLYLERAVYNGYNRKLDNVKSDLPRIDFKKFQDERDAFKTLYIYAPVVAKEKSDKIMKAYLSVIDRGHIGIEKENVDIINWIKDLESKEIEWVKQAKKNETNPDWQ